VIDIDKAGIEHISCNGFVIFGLVLSPYTPSHWLYQAGHDKMHVLDGLFSKGENLYILAVTQFGGIICNGILIPADAERLYWFAWDFISQRKRALPCQGIEGGNRQVIYLLLSHVEQNADGPFDAVEFVKIGRNRQAVYVLELLHGDCTP
jgi:hypothetical protein